MRSLCPQKRGPPETLGTGGAGRRCARRRCCESISFQGNALQGFPPTTPGLCWPVPPWSHEEVLHLASSLQACCPRWSRKRPQPCSLRGFACNHRKPYAALQQTFRCLSRVRPCGCHAPLPRMTGTGAQEKLLLSAGQQVSLKHSRCIFTSGTLEPLQAPLACDL